MGLTTEKAKEEFAVTQVLLELASGLKKLQANPDLDKLAKQAYDLPEDYKARAEKAAADIATNQALIAEQKKLEASLKAEQDNIDRRLSDLETLDASLEAKNTGLNKRERNLDEKESEIDAKKADLEKQESVLKEAQNKLQIDEKALKESQKKLEAEKAELNSKAEQVKALIG